MCAEAQDLDYGDAKGPQGALDAAIAAGTRGLQSPEMAALHAPQTVVMEGGDSDGDLMVTNQPTLTSGRRNTDGDQNA